MSENTITISPVPEDPKFTEFLATHNRILEGLHAYVTRMPAAYALSGDLRKMRDDRLYLNLLRENGKPKLKTFADYVRYLGTELKVINFQHRATAYKVFKETDVLVRLGDSTKQLPVARSVLGELAKLQPDHQASVWLDTLKDKQPAKVRPTDIQAAAAKRYDYEYPEPAQSQSQILTLLREQAPEITPLIKGQELEIKWTQFLAILFPAKHDRKSAKTKCFPLEPVANDVDLDVPPPESGSAASSDVPDVQPDKANTENSDNNGFAEVNINPVDIVDANVPGASPQDRPLNVEQTEPPPSLSDAISDQSQQDEVIVPQQTDAGVVDGTTPLTPADAGNLPDMRNPADAAVTEWPKNIPTLTCENNALILVFASPNQYEQYKVFVPFYKIGFRFEKTLKQWRRRIDDPVALQAAHAETKRLVLEAAGRIENGAEGNKL